MDQLHPPAIEDIPSTPPELRIGGAPPPSRPRRRWIWLLIIAVLAAGLYFWSRNRAPVPASSSSTAAGGRGKGAGTIPVVAVKATKGNIGVYVTGLGAVTPLHTVTVASQISGYLMKVDYKEGDMVQQGALLAEIDPRPYQV
jgi:membrane fusion protein, multidrug efflux system